VRFESGHIANINYFERNDLIRQLIGKRMTLFQRNQGGRRKLRRIDDFAFGLPGAPESKAIWAKHNLDQDSVHESREYNVRQKS
jgi:hypothetical protein